MRKSVFGLSAILLCFMMASCSSPVEKLQSLAEDIEKNGNDWTDEDQWDEVLVKHAEILIAFAKSDPSKEELEEFDDAYIELNKAQNDIDDEDAKDAMEKAVTNFEKKHKDLHKDANNAFKKLTKIVEKYKKDDDDVDSDDDDDDLPTLSLDDDDDLPTLSLDDDDDLPTLSSDDDDDSPYSSSKDNEDKTASSSSSSSSGSEDWNALLNSYEQYVDKYISYAKKAAKGDMSALAEYPSLMEKAQECSEKMENAQGEMSSSQWARYMKITDKMTKAALELQ